MNAFVRQLAVLSVLWSFCELLLPEGRQQKMVRMTVSVLVMAALLTAVRGLANSPIAPPTPEAPALSQAGEESYARLALRSVANQAESLCVRIARGSGYRASAAVYLRLDGSLERVELRLLGRAQEDTPPLLTEEAVAAHIAEQLKADRSLICLLPPKEEAGE